MPIRAAVSAACRRQYRRRATTARWMDRPLPSRNRARRPRIAAAQRAAGSRKRRRARSSSVARRGRSFRSLRLRRRLARLAQVAGQVEPYIERTRHDLAARRLTTLLLVDHELVYEQIRFAVLQIVEDRRERFEIAAQPGLHGDVLVQLLFAAVVRLCAIGRAALLVLGVIGDRLIEALDQPRRRRVLIGVGEKRLVALLARVDRGEPLFDLRLLRGSLAEAQLLIAKILHVRTELQMRRDEPPVNADQIDQ